MMPNVEVEQCINHVTRFTRRHSPQTHRLHFPEMRLPRFEMERLQSIWEHQVAWNVSESGVEPLRVEELARTDAEREAVMRQALGYTQTNGTLELRALIAVHLSRRAARQHHGHQRRIGSELHHAHAPPRTR